MQLRNRFLSSALTVVSLLPLVSCAGFICFSSGSPQIVRITPVTVVSGSSSVQVTIVGNNFSNGTLLILNDGTQLVPASIGPTSMTVVFGAGFFSGTGTINFHLSNPCGGFSNTVFITVVSNP
jgi:hypothetical protein